jgi:hypothetical protein
MCNRLFWSGLRMATRNGVFTVNNINCAAFNFIQTQTPAASIMLISDQNKNRLTSNDCEKPYHGIHTWDSLVWRGYTHPGRPTEFKFTNDEKDNNYEE